MGLFVRIASLDTPSVIRVLCDSPDPVAHANLTINNQRVLQIEDLAWAAWKSIRDTGNRLNEVSFEVTRAKDDAETDFADGVSAAAWAMDHANDCPVVGNIEFRLGGGGAAATRFLAGGAVQGVELVRQIGPTLRLRYSLIGGEFLKKLPTT